MPLVAPLLVMLGDMTVPVIFALSSTIIVVVFLMVYWAASTLFGVPLRWLVGWIPIVGTQIGNAIGGWITSVAQAGLSWINNSASNLVRPILLIPMLVVAGVNTAVGAVEWLIQQALNLGASIAQTAYSLLVNVAVITIKLIEHSGLIALLQSSVAAVTNTTEWIYKTFVPQQIQAALAVAASYAAGLVAASEVLLRNEINAVSTDVAAVDAALSADVAAIDSTITTEVWPAIDNLVSVVDTLAPLAVPATVAAVLADVTFLATTWTVDAAECAILGCAAVSPFYAMLNLLQDAELFVGLSALTVACVERPNETAHEAASVANEIIGLGRSIAGAFTGLGL